MICNNCQKELDEYSTTWETGIDSGSLVMCCDKCIRQLVKAVLDLIPTKFVGRVKKYVTESYPLYLQYILQFRPELIREHLLGNVHDVSLHQCEFAMLPNGLPEMDFADWYMESYSTWIKHEGKEREF
jgi:hypothetical protein